MEPTNISKIYDDTWRVFLKYKHYVFLFCVIFYLPIHTLLAFVGPVEPLQGEESSLKVSALIMILGVIGALVYLIASAFMIFLVQAYRNNETPGFKALLEKTKSIFGGFFSTTVLGALLLGALSLALIVPGVIFFVFWAFMSEAVVLRGKINLDALNYSKSLVKGRWWKTFGYILALVVVFAIAAFVPMFLVNFVVEFSKAFVTIPEILLRLVELLTSMIDSFVQMVALAGFAFMFFQWEESRGET